MPDLRRRPKQESEVQLIYVRGSIVFIASFDDRFRVCEEGLKVIENRFPVFDASFHFCSRDADDDVGTLSTGRGLGD
ncbi:MAG: hypothetical protein WCT03_16610 [Candidatus Obscuribacterales bacterium]